MCTAVGSLYHMSMQSYPGSCRVRSW